MSGRFALFRWSPAFAALPGFPAEQQPHWNLAPGARVLMLRGQAGEQRLDLARWGLTPAWLTDLSKTPPTPAPKPWSSSRCSAMPSASAVA